MFIPINTFNQLNYPMIPYSSGERGNCELPYVVAKLQTLVAKDDSH